MLNKDFVAIIRREHGLQLIYAFFSIFVLLFVFRSIPVYADLDVVDEYDQLRLNAFVRPDEVTDGTAEFDENDSAGNDSSAHNHIVRSFDTITYPLKITLNSKNGETLNDIKLRISGTLHNGFINGRGNARFAIGNQNIKIDDQNYKVCFEREYTMKRSGEALMIPIAVDVQAAEENIELYPDNLSVEVISINGKPINNMKVNLTGFDPIRVSAKVSIGAKLYTSWLYGVSTYNYVKFVPDGDSDWQMHQAGVTIFGKPLPGKKTIKGATLPLGRINFQFIEKGNVSWDDHEDQNRALYANELPYLFDYQSIYFDSYQTPSVNSWAYNQGITSYRKATTLGVGSVVSNIKGNESDSSRMYERAVWDSGNWYVDLFQKNLSTIVYNGFFENYRIGNSFPDRRADLSTVMFGQNEKPFASRSFELLSHGPFDINGVSNPNKWSNMVNYRFDIKLTSYVDKDGKTIALNENAGANSSDNNRFGSGEGITTRFFHANGSDIGTPHPGWAEMPSGDEAIVPGDDVLIRSAWRINSRTRGGYSAIWKWNTDSFELTDDYADKLKYYFRTKGYRRFDGSLKNWNSRDTQGETPLYFGVAKYATNDFNKVHTYKKDDYNWYINYGDAIKKGVVGAIMFDVNDDVEYSVWESLGTASEGRGFRLHVKTGRIGSINEKGTYNFISSGYYLYADKERTIFNYYDSNIQNLTEYSDDGSIAKLQFPNSKVMDTDTLGIVPAITSSKVVGDKNTYYSSDKLHLTLKSSIILPQSMNNNNDASELSLNVILPKSLQYVSKSAYYIKNTQKVYIEPIITKDSDGGSHLSWDYLLEKNAVGTIHDIYFDTTVVSLFLGNKSSDSVTVQSYVDSKYDIRPVEKKIFKNDFTILKIGQLGVYEYIDKEYGYRNSDYVVHLIPYTTIDDEKNVSGLTYVPQNNDAFGSRFSGSTFLKNINVDSVNGVELFVNTTRVERVNPNKIDVSSNGWVPYGKAVEMGILNKVKSIYFRIPGVLTSQDKVQIDLHFGTNGNRFYDRYANEVILNSSINYPMSPISNRVVYEIRAAVELGIKKIQIYTDKASKGLPVKVYLNKQMLQSIDDSLDYTISLYDKELNKKISSKTHHTNENISEISFLIPKDLLKVDDHRIYEVRLEAYDDNKIYIAEGNDVLATEGWTSEEKIIEQTDIDVLYKGVVMTEREVGKNMVKFYETISIPAKVLPKTKTGYGYNLPEYQVKYNNDIHNYDGSFDAKLSVNDSLVDKGVRSTTSRMVRNINHRVVFDMYEQDSQYKFMLPEMSVHIGDGMSYLKDDVMRLSDFEKGDYLDGGRKLYIPIWLTYLSSDIDRLNKDANPFNDVEPYVIDFYNEQPFGINQMVLKLHQKLNVYAYMYEASRSETIMDDEMMLRPVVNNLHL